MVGISAGPASARTVQARQRQALIPTARVPVVEGHGAGPGGDRGERSLKKLVPPEADRRDLAPEIRQKTDHAIPGLDENVFFAATASLAAMVPDLLFSPSFCGPARLRQSIPPRFR